MQIKGFFTVLAACLSVAVAEDWGTASDWTTTSTSTLTKTLTITQCNPSFTNCPNHTPAWNSSVSASPTWYANTTSWAIPTKAPTVTGTSVYPVVPTKATTTSALPTSGAAGLFLQSGLMLTILGAGVALVA